MAKYNVETVSNDDLYAMTKLVVGRWVKVFNSCYGVEETPYGLYGEQVHSCIEKDLDVVLDAFGISKDNRENEDANTENLINYFLCAEVVIVLSLGRNPSITKEETQAILNAGLKYAKTGDQTGFLSEAISSVVAKDLASCYKRYIRHLFVKRVVKQAA